MDASHLTIWKDLKMQIIKSLGIAALILTLFIVSAQVSAEPNNANTTFKRLSWPETQTLVFMREEEKMARDVYLTSYALWAESVFNNIASAEQQHIDTLKVLFDKYRLDDLTPAEMGVFLDPALQELYDNFIMLVMV